MTQVDIFAEPSEIDAAFWQFHKSNPEVYNMIVKLARDAYLIGRSKIGMKAIFEVIRWNRMFEVNSKDYKLNNNYTSRYVRLLEEDHSELAKMFEKRRIKS